MADIATYSPGDIIFIEDMKELYAQGEISEIMKVSMTASTASATVTVEENLYGDFEGIVPLDFTDIVQGLVDPKIPADTGLQDTMEWGVLSTWNIGDSSVGLFIFPFTKDSRERITDIDYLAVPEDLMFNVFFMADAGSSYSVGILAGGKYIEFSESTEVQGEPADIISIWYRLSELSLEEQVFQIAVKVISGDGQTEKVLKSPVYEIIAGEFQQYLFAGRFGGFTAFPMCGALELSTEHEFENARHSLGYAKVSASGSPVMRQYTGGLTAKASAALSELLLSEHIYHNVHGVWRKILIEEADISSLTTDSLHFGSFSFKYAEDLQHHDIVL